MNRAAWFRAGFRSLVAGSALALATAASAADGWVSLPFTSFQLSIASGATQVFSKATPVYGLRVSALYGSQSNVVGVDFGPFNDADSMTGVGVGFCNMSRGNSAGIHLGIGCNDSEADFAGLQTSLVNLVGGRLAGLQFGLANSSESGAGLQIGLMNYTQSMRGLQLGLLNWNGHGFLPLFPFVNFRF